MKGNSEIKFGIKIKRPRGASYCAKFVRKVRNEIQNIAVPATEKGTVMSYEKAHDLFSHAGKDMTMKIAKHLSFKVGTKDKDPCKDCIVAKAKQKDIPKISQHQRSATVGERRFLDISSVKQKKKCKNKLQETLGCTSRRSSWL